ncbi:PIN domain-containing protein [Microcoleus sp. FACHB-SPT15]|uniref:PIN domain-containing protein n=1 Tax=Microcoleus sp. FACHB-SPT15 TaxID=2692830 RepID=UPI00177ACA2C|nr:PIN domain-containing protein [Microcoleus sp. FACHB-SPT15]MBD1806190.1 PIN domain-containing protein [Microcoleus sp. FACHB-SPT15]
MPSIFADSSVLIAGAGSPTGASRAVLTMAEIGLFKLVISQQVIEECQRNLSRKLPAAIPIFTQLLTAIDPEIQPNPPVAELARWTSIIEAKDVPILAAAVLANIDRLLTLNTKDFTPEVAAQSGLIIQTPAEFIREIREIVERGLQ